MKLLGLVGQGLILTENQCSRSDSVGLDKSQTEPELQWVRPLKSPQTLRSMAKLIWGPRSGPSALTVSASRALICHCPSISTSLHSSPRPWWGWREEENWAWVGRDRSLWGGWRNSLLWFPVNPSQLHLTQKTMLKKNLMSASYHTDYGTRFSNCPNHLPQTMHTQEVIAAHKPILYPGTEFPWITLLWL